MSKQLIDIVVNALEDIKGKDIVTMDVSDLTDVMDQIVVASGTSSRHVKALADSVMEKAKKSGYKPLGTEGERGAEWILVDLGDVVVHLMLPATREFYDLERLWQNPAHHPDRSPQSD